MSTQDTNSVREPVMGEMEGGRRPTGVSPITGTNPQVADPEVSEVVKRRKHTASYKLRILKEADACTEQGQIGALLRREGLYHSNLTSWRKQRDEGSLQSLSCKRGRKKKSVHPLTRKVEELEREVKHLRIKLNQAEMIIDVQKKISEILGIQMKQTEEMFS